MPLTNFVKDLQKGVADLETAGTAKGAEPEVGVAEKSRSGQVGSPESPPASVPPMPGCLIWNGSSTRPPGRFYCRIRCWTSDA